MEATGVKLGGDRQSVIKQLGDALRTGGWQEFVKRRAEISDRYNLDVRQTLDLGTLTAGEVGPLYDLEHAKAFPFKAGRIAYTNSQAPIAPDGLSPEQASEWMAGWDDGASREPEARAARPSGEVVGEARVVGEQPQLEAPSQQPAPAQTIAARKKARQHPPTVRGSGSMDGTQVDELRQLANSFRERGDSNGKTFANVLDQFASEVEQGARTEESVAQMAAAYRDMLDGEPKSQQQSGVEGAVPYSDGQQLEAGDLLAYFDVVISGSVKGEKIVNPRFHIGEVDSDTASQIATYIDGYDGQQRRLRVSGRTLKHIHESRPAISREIVAQLPGMFTKPDEVLPDPRHVQKRALLVKERKAEAGQSKPKSYVATVEVEIEVEVRDGFIDIVTIMTAPDRSLREARELKKNWPEGQQRTEQTVNSPHPLAPEAGANPAADFPDARPEGSSVAQPAQATQPDGISDPKLANDEAPTPSAEVSAPTKPAPTESPNAAGLEAIFEGLQGRGLKKKAATEAAKAHPLAERITLVDKHILDILSDLDDSGTIKINC